MAERTRNPVDHASDSATQTLTVTESQPEQATVRFIKFALV